MILLDTHTWIWFVSNPDFLSQKAREAVDIAVKSLCENYLVESYEKT